VVNGGEIFAGTLGDGVLHSSDNGTTWTHVNSGLTDTVVYSLALEGAGSSSPRLFAGTTTGVFVTSDDGANWHSVNSGLPSTFIRAMAAISTAPNTNYVFAGTNAGIYATVNDGTTWGLVQPTPGSQSIGMLTAIGTNLLAGTAKGIALSTNNGTAWTDVSVGLPSCQVNCITTDAANLFVGTNGNGVWRRPLSQLITQGVSAQEPVRSPAVRTYPNPFSHSTTVSVRGLSGFATVSIVNVLGAEVSRLFSGELRAEEHAFTWDASGMPAGMYLCVVRSGTGMEQLPIVVLR
jgi:ligand-binding sensor domain-containing protein